MKECQKKDGLISFNGEKRGNHLLKGSHGPEGEWGEEALRKLAGALGEGQSQDSSMSSPGASLLPTEGNMALRTGGKVTRDWGGGTWVLLSRYEPSTVRGHS